MIRRHKPIIMTATMGSSDFAWANALRKRYFPPEKNQISAHITLFHHLPPQALDEIVRTVQKVTSDYACPPCRLVGVMNLGRGVAYRLESDRLAEIRSFFSEAFYGLLTRQDQQTPRFHVTVQNKVSPEESKILFRKLNKEFLPRPFEITGLELSYYMDGPWEDIGSWRFRGKF